MKSISWSFELPNIHITQLYYALCTRQVNCDSSHLPKCSKIHILGEPKNKIQYIKKLLVKIYDYF